MDTRVAEAVTPRSRRRRFLLPGPEQKGAVARVAGLAVLLLGAFDLTYYGMLRASSARLTARAPELSGFVRAQDGEQMLLVLLGSAITFAGIVLLTVFETHRTAGPLHNLVQRLDELGRPGSSVRLRFRRDDRFRDVETAFNAAAERLERRERERGAAVERLAARTREASRLLALPGTDPAAVATELWEASAELQRIAEGTP